MYKNFENRLSSDRDITSLMPLWTYDFVFLMAEQWLATRALVKITHFLACIIYLTSTSQQVWSSLYNCNFKRALKEDMLGANTTLLGSLFEGLTTRW